MTQLLATIGIDITTHMGIWWLSVLWIFSVITVIWAIGLAQGNHSMMDGFYGFAYASQCWICYYFSGANSAIAAAVLVITSLHGCRLGFYLSKRWVGYRSNGGGDQRYIGFTTHKLLKNGYWWKSFFAVMQSQTVVIVLIGVPSTFGVMALTAPNATSSINLLTIFGLLVFGVGYYFEVVADGQLQSYKQEKEKDKAYYKGKYLQSGVWTHTRHPNYFGNTTVWWGIWLVAVSGNCDYWWTIIGPGFNTIMLTKILGKQFQDNFMGARPEYQELMKKTRAFLPIPPGK